MWNGLDNIIEMGVVFSLPSETLAASGMSSMVEATVKARAVKVADGSELAVVEKEAVVGGSDDVVGEVLQTDLGARAYDADGAHEQPHAVFLIGEDVLDGRSWTRPGRVCPFPRLGHRFPGRFAKMHLRDEPPLHDALFILHRAICSIGPN